MGAQVVPFWNRLRIHLPLPSWQKRNVTEVADQKKLVPRWNRFLAHLPSPSYGGCVRLARTGKGRSWQKENSGRFFHPFSAKRLQLARQVLAQPNRAANIHRRHLSKGQAAMIVAKGVSETDTSLKRSSRLSGISRNDYGESLCRNTQTVRQAGR
jgi:hypothetical protein